MNRCLKQVAVFFFLTFSSVALAQPTIEQIYSPPEMRVMDSASMAVVADAAGDERALEYRWTVVSAPSGTNPVLHFASGHTCVLELWWQSADAADQAVGQSVAVEIAVSYQGSDPALEPPTTGRVSILIRGVNHPPVPIIGGNLGRRDARIPTPAAVSLSSHSTDPDGDSPRVDWGLGATSGPGSYQMGDPAMYGTNGASSSLAITQRITGDIDQKVLIRLTDGLHVVEKTATVFLTPGEQSSSAPVLSLSQSTVTVEQGLTAKLEAQATDSDGDNLAFTWAFLQSGTTTSLTSVDSRVSDTSWVSSVSVPTTGILPGTYRIGVEAREVGTASQLSSGTKEITLVVETSTPANVRPTVRLRYDAGDGYKLLSSGQTVDTNSLNVALDAGQSTDDGGAEHLTYTWTVNGPGQLAKSSGTSNSLTISEGATSKVDVVVTARDAGYLTDSVTVGFQYSKPNEPPVARLRYNLGNGFSEPQSSGATVETVAHQIELDASPSTDDKGIENLQFSWSVSGQASLTAQNGETTTLSIAQSATSSVTVTLSARDASNAASTAEVIFRIVAPNEPPTASLRYDPDGDGLFAGPITDDQSIETESSSISLDASASTDDGGAQNLSYQWSAQGIDGVSVSPADESLAVLTIPAAQSGTVTVRLTVEDEKEQSDTITLTVRYTASVGDLQAQITKVPDQVEAGEDFGVEGAVEGGPELGDYRFVWSATDSAGQNVEVYSTGNRARVFAPTLSELGEETLAVSLTVYLDGVASEPAQAQVKVTNPTLYFAQLAVGNINADLGFQTCVVLVNNSEEVANGEITLINNEFGEDWSVLVNGSEQSAFSFEIPSDGAQKFVLTGENVELGWMTLTSNLPLTGHLFYQVLDRHSGRVVREAPILPTTGRGFRTALDAGVNDDIALALVNISEEALRYRLVILSESGELMTSDEFTLAPHEHVARFLRELFGGSQNASSQIPASFQGGTLAVEVVDGNGELAATIMKTDQDLPLSILPVATW